MIRVSTLDAAMLYAETPEMPMHTMGVLVLERRRAWATDSSEGSRLSGRASGSQNEFISSRRSGAGSFRGLCKSATRTGSKTRRSISTDISCALRSRSRGHARALRFRGEFAGHCLERDRPLWNAVVVEGLEGGKIALVMKIHHAAMDGGRSAAIAGQLLDTSPEGRVIPPPEEPWVPDREPTIPWLAADTLRTLVGKPRRAVDAAAKSGFGGPRQRASKPAAVRRQRASREGAPVRGAANSVQRGPHARIAPWRWRTSRSTM